MAERYEGFRITIDSLLRERGLLTNVHLPLLPLELVSIHLETDPLGLDNVKGLQIIPNLEIFITFGDEVWEEIKSLGRRRDTFPVGVIQRQDVQWVRRCCGCRKVVFFFLFIDICVMSREVNVYDFPARGINDRDKVLRGETFMGVLLETGLVAYQRVSI
jgi:hypothetical protein